MPFFSVSLFLYLNARYQINRVTVYVYTVRCFVSSEMFLAVLQQFILSLISRRRLQLKCLNNFSLTSFYQYYEFRVFGDKLLFSDGEFKYLFIGILQLSSDFRKIYHLCCHEANCAHPSVLSCFYKKESCNG